MYFDVFVQGRWRQVLHDEVLSIWGPWIDDIKVLWNEYENDKPVYNFETRSINKNNLNSYADYLTPEALNKVTNPSMQANAQTPEMVQVIAPNGQVGNIPRDKLDEALKLGLPSIKETDD